MNLGGDPASGAGERTGIDRSVASVAALRSLPEVQAELAGPGAAIADLGARVVGEGANLAVIEAKSTGDLLFRERVGGTWLASPIQV